MTLDEISALLDAKLDPLTKEVQEIKRHLFGNGQAGLRERIGLLESECKRRGEATNAIRALRLAVFVAVIGGLFGIASALLRVLAG